MLNVAGTVVIDAEYPTIHASQLRHCFGCNCTFVRIKMPIITLADGTKLDPNDYCTKCEMTLVNSAKARKAEAEQFRIDVINNQRKHHTLAELSQMERECLRKDAFDTMSLARTVAKRMRSRKKNHGKAPSEAYRCTALIDPALYPDRAKTHFHIGGVKSARKL